MVFDSTHERLIHFGGSNPYDNIKRNDTWTVAIVFDTARWVHLAPGGNVPLGRAKHEAVYDPVRDRMIVMDGLVGSGNLYANEIYVLDLAGTPTWSRKTTPATPYSRVG